MQDQILDMKSSGGNILITDDSLILRHVTEQQQGSYRCVAKNQVGSGTSNVIDLAVKCEYSSSILWSNCLINHSRPIFQYFLLFYSISSPDIQDECDQKKIAKCL